MITTSRFDINIEPLGEWRRPVTQRPVRAKFTASWSDTKARLETELRQLGTTGPVAMRLDVTEQDILRDGVRLRASARPATARVAISFESRHGPLTYATDAYDSWQDNVRAIALSLEALRAVNRYGVSHAGEQYTGWRAIEGPRPGFASRAAAIAWLRAQPDLGDTDAMQASDLLRRAARVMHPDVDADRSRWDRLESARRVLNGGT